MSTNSGICAHIRDMREKCIEMIRLNEALRVMSLTLPAHMDPHKHLLNGIAFNDTACELMLKYNSKTLDEMSRIEQTERDDHTERNEHAEREHRMRNEHAMHKIHLPTVHDPAKRVRQEVLIETIKHFMDRPNESHNRGMTNLKRWALSASPSAPSNRRPFTLFMEELDWGELALAMTKRFGKTFAVLNMANAYSPGGGYLTGCAAQEENMFRRTDCHFSLLDNAYTQADTALINAQNGIVYLDIDHPRVCVRGRELARSRDRISSPDDYKWLAESEIFPFYELRSAALDRRGEVDRWGVMLPMREDEQHETAWRVRAMLQTLKNANVRHVVFGAFGCGAFNNPAEVVAHIFKKELHDFANDFDVVAFGIYHAGYGPRNIDPFRTAFGDRVTVLQ